MVTFFLKECRIIQFEKLMQSDPQDIYCYINSDFIVFKKTVTHVLLYTCTHVITPNIRILDIRHTLFQNVSYRHNPSFPGRGFWTF